jgi:hypothetical protein
MDNKALSKTIKLLLGKEVSQEDKQYLRDRTIKYELVRYLVIEHYKLTNKPDLTNFQFTPGDSFDTKSALEIANAIVNADLSKAKPLKFGDLRSKE